VDESVAVGCNHVLLDAIIRFQKPYLHPFHPVRRHAFSSTCACPRGGEGNIPENIQDAKRCRVNAGYNNHKRPQALVGGGGIMGGYLIFKVTARLVPGIFKNQNQRTVGSIYFKNLKELPGFMK
jgi:hypothetical protein